MTDEPLDPERFGARLARMANRCDEARVLIHMGEVTYISSRGLGKLVALYKKLKAAGGTIELFGPRDNVSELFRITHTDHLFEIHDGDAFPIAVPEGDEPELASLEDGEAVVVYAPKGNVF